MVVPLLNQPIIEVSGRQVIHLLELYLLRGPPAPWQRSTKKRWSKESYRKQEEKHEALIILKLNK